MKKENKIKVFESKPTVGGFEKKNFGSPKGIGILAPIVLKKMQRRAK